MAGKVSLETMTGTLLQGTSALQCKSGIIGGAAGTAWDTEICGVYILLSAGPATLTIAGQVDNTGAAQSMVLSGQVTIDTWIPFTVPIVNSKAAFVFTPSVAAKVWVYTRAYNGPENPGTRVTD